MGTYSKTYTVYIVDGDNSSRNGLSNLLNIAGYKVESFASVAEFLTIQTIDSHSCLIIDAWVKDLFLDNVQTAMINKTSDLPKIFLSAQDDKTSMNRAIQAEGSSFFRKPVDGPALIDAISWQIEIAKTHSK